ncbi:uncharacterized protein LOC122509718 [Leptopilina heterotoma]|uniref:uncharacterized protein LOC122509718 n=1 Tax=Leptopilina heterotoma TaxID=63436 RepID=UPI001CA8408F|nr:uncharacterized protein LOC122509718 [Leptopilina heterotoma]
MSGEKSDGYAKLVENMRKRVEIYAKNKAFRAELIVERELSVVEILQGHKIEALLEKVLEMQQISEKSRGLLISFGTWAPAPVRKDEDSFWSFDQDLARGRGKIHPAQSWFQEYFWDEEDEAYIRRGFWAPKSFRNPVRVNAYLPGLKMVVGRFPKNGLPEISLLKDLPTIPGHIGVQPLRKGLKIIFLQCHDWLGMNQPRTRGWWQLRLDVDNKSAWHTFPVPCPRAIAKVEKKEEEEERVNWEEEEEEGTEGSWEEEETTEGSWEQETEESEVNYEEEEEGTGSSWEEEFPNSLGG